MHTRLQHGLLGALAGLFFWSISGGILAQHMFGERAVFGLTVLGLVFFGTALAMLGEIGARKALSAAVVIAVPVAALGWWEAGSFDQSRAIAGQFGFGLLALFLLSSLPLPFAMVMAMRGRASWNDYPALFSHSWNIVVRYAAAALFLGLVWLLLYLSGDLLRSVEIDFLRDFLRRVAFAWPLAGAIFGVGLAVVTELEEMISPALILRLLRLLLPVVLLVAVLFVLGLIFRKGAMNFAGLSQAETLIAMALAAVGLVSIGVEREDDSAVQARILRVSAQGLALALPVLVASAAWIEWQRVAELGWTPSRLAVALLTLLLGGYALGYAGSVLSGRNWMVRLRRVNVAMAGAVLAAALLWLTPLVAPNRIATESQIALYQAGKIEAVRLPLYAMRNDWGMAGKAGIARLEKMAAEDLALQAVLSRQATAKIAQSERIAALRTEIVVPPEAETPSDALLEALLRDAGGGANSLCLPRADGSPSCALVRADFLPDVAGEEAMLIRQAPYTNIVSVFRQEDGKWLPIGRSYALDGVTDDPLRGDLGPVIAAIAKGQMAIVPSGIQGLRVDGRLILPATR